MQESNEPECMINSSDKSKEAQKHVKRNKECGDNEHNDHRVMNKGQDALVSMKNSGQDATLLGIPSKKQCAVQITAQVPISEETKKEGSEGPKTRNKEVRVKKGCSLGAKENKCARGKVRGCEAEEPVNQEQACPPPSQSLSLHKDPHEDDAHKAKTDVPTEVT